MTAVLRIGDSLVTPTVTARAVLPLPALPHATSDEPTEVELLTVTGPAGVVASALDSLAAHLDEFVPMIANLYDDVVHPSPTQGG